MARTQQLTLKALDGLRGPLCIGVVAINMGLYNAGANLPVGVFLVLSGLTAFVAYHDCSWDDAAARAQFFRRRLVRLLPMLLVSTVLQLIATLPWLLRPGLQIPERTSGGYFTAGTTLAALILILAGCGALCRGRACGCCQIDRWPRPACALFPLIFGAYLHGTGWYVGLLLFLNAYFLPKLLAAFGDRWRSAPPSWPELVGWALLEALQFGLPLLAREATHSADVWYAATLYVYLGGPPLFRLNTFVFGLQLGRWSLFAAQRDPQLDAAVCVRNLDTGVAITVSQLEQLYATVHARPFEPITPERGRIGSGMVGHAVAAATTQPPASERPPRATASSVATEATTLVPTLATALVVVCLHGFLQPESEMHRPDTGTTLPRWVLIHALHPFNVLALVCSLVRAPSSLIARALASPPLAKLAELSYAIYLLHVGVVIVYVWACDKRWIGETEALIASRDASALDAADYGRVVLLSTALAYPVTRWVEPRVATWLRARVEPVAEPSTSLL
tara:strand:+ start:774 stop:2294 length:1521 start_codon:yes stop_codon:yes gene_type:complete